jgi:hypothetical protein
MPSPAKEPPTREYPLSALYVASGPLQLGDAPADAERVPVEMLVRSNEAVERYGQQWFHDFAGMRAKSRVLIDYRHDPDQVIGYLDTFEVRRDGLHASGFLVPFDEDVTRGIIYRAKAGVPYEASIYFGGNGMRIEEVSPNAQAQVNGKKVQGPAVIFREWPLRGVAVVPYGADGKTRTKLQNEGTIAVPVVRAEETPMTNEKRAADEPLTKKGFFEALAQALGFRGNDEAPAKTEGDGLGDSPAPEPKTIEPERAKQEEGADVRAKVQLADPPAASPETPPDRSACKRFLDAFGPDGGQWYADGLSFEEAQARHTAKLSERLAKLEGRLAAVDRGEEEPAEFDGEDGHAQDSQRSAQLQRALGPALGKFAASITLPARRNGRG